MLAVVTEPTGDIERVSQLDLVMLAMNAGGQVPEQLGAVLVLDTAPASTRP
jgi:hypothetical protein